MRYISSQHWYYLTLHPQTLPLFDTHEAGARLSGYDLKASGLATHYIPSQHLQQLAALLAALGPAAADLSVVDRTLKALEAAAGVFSCLVPMPFVCAFDLNVFCCELDISVFLVAAYRSYKTAVQLTLGPAAALPFTYGQSAQSAIVQ